MQSHFHNVTLVIYTSHRALNAHKMTSETSPRIRSRARTAGATSSSSGRQQDCMVSLISILCDIKKHHPSPSDKAKSKRTELLHQPTTAAAVWSMDEMNIQLHTAANILINIARCAQVYSRSNTKEQTSL